MAITTKLNTRIIDIGGGDKWIKFYGNPIAKKVGLTEMVKTHTQDGKLSNISYTFQENPLKGYVNVNGTPEKMKKMWEIVSKMEDKKSVIEYLTFLSKVMG